MSDEKKAGRDEKTLEIGLWRVVAEGCFYSGTDAEYAENWKITHDVTIDINKGFKVGFFPT